MSNFSREMVTGFPCPLPDNEFDGVRIDRSLQHMKDPHSAIKEMVRVTRPEGHIVAAEPDWETFVLYNGDLDIGVKLAEQFKGSIRNPYVGRELGMIFTKCGVVNPQCDIHAFCTTDFKCATVVFDLARVRDRCIQLGILRCKFARNNDPLRGDFASNSNPS
jgi:SAM-dependent methyltransferase